jgi:hypothetical protein
MDGGVSSGNPELVCSTIYLVDSIELAGNRAPYDPAVLHQKYVLERATLAQIGKELLCSQGAVRHALLKAGIPLRRRCDPGYLTPGRPYGVAVVKGRRVGSPLEQRVIETIKALRHDGLSFDKIAERLTQLSIPTKTRRKKWNGGCVRAIHVKHDQDGPDGEA